MKRRALIVSVVMLVGGTSLVGPEGAAGHRQGKSCGPAKAMTLRRGRGARVFELPAKGPGRGQPTYGCLFSSGHSWRLDPAGDWTFLNPETLVLSASWVAFSTTSMGVDGGGSGISVRNLRTGAVTQGFPAITKPTQPVPETFSSVPRIVLQKDGNVAWIGQENTISGERRLQVEVADSAGFSVADEGPGIEPESLILSGSRLTWTDSGETRTAQLF